MLITLKRLRSSLEGAGVIEMLREHLFCGKLTMASPIMVFAPNKILCPYTHENQIGLWSEAIV